MFSILTVSSSIGFAFVGLVAPAFSKIAYNPHSPVVIDSRADPIANAGSEGWPGTGSEPDPYVIISNCDMDATGEDSAIHIAHTSLYSVIEGCVLHGANAAIST